MWVYLSTIRQMIFIFNTFNVMKMTFFFIDDILGIVKHIASLWRSWKFALILMQVSPLFFFSFPCAHHSSFLFWYCIHYIAQSPSICSQALAIHKSNFILLAPPSLVHLQTSRELPFHALHATLTSHLRPPPTATPTTCPLLTHLSYFLQCVV